MLRPPAQSLLVLIGIQKKGPTQTSNDKFWIVNHQELLPCRKSGRGDAAKKRKEAQRQPRDEEHNELRRKKQRKDLKLKTS